MAAPITHIALTVKVFDEFFKNKSRKDFFVGSLFPDIRYLKVIERNKTHFDKITLKNIIPDDSFTAGIKFHSIIDETREKFMVKNDVYSLCPDSKHIVQSLKILEDEIFYQYIKDWQEYIDYLNGVLPDEINLGVGEKDIKKWHFLLQRYFQKQPNEQTITDFIISIGFSDEVAREINGNIAVMRTNERIINILKKLHDNFNSLITRHESRIDR